MIKCMTNFLQVQLYQHDDMLCDYPSMLRTAVIMSMCRCVLDNYVYNITTTNKLGLSEVGVEKKVKEREITYKSYSEG